MTNKYLYYSVLRYSPSRLAGEVINLGILFCDSDNRVSFSHIKRFTRLSHFDDEINVKEVEELLISIEKEVNTQASKGLFDIDKFIEFYINTFVFDEPKRVICDDFEQKVAFVEGIYLRYDKDKKNRLSLSEDKRLIEELVRANDMSIKKRVSYIGSCNDKVQYDFATDKYYLKYFDFDSKNIARSISSAKTWAWNGMQLDGDKKLLIIYRYDEEESTHREEFDTIMRIFEKSGIDTCDVLDSDLLLKKIAV